MDTLAPNDEVLLSADAIEAMAERLAAGKVLRKKLPVGGRVHIDRPQPFLCVYRQPVDRDDTGTERLLLGQASYILSDGSERFRRALKQLISRLSEVVTETYGAVLVLEVWSAPDAAVPAQDQMARADFQIHAAGHGVPDATIETLQHALLATTENLATEITIKYRAGAAPPGLPPLLSEDEEERQSAFLVGLEVPPIYRDPASGKIIPKELRRFTAMLGQALRQAFYIFAHARASYRPVHYQELGRRAMTDAVSVADKGLGAVGDSFDLLLHVTPVNAEAAYRSFAEAGYQTIPEFLYRPQTIDPSALKHTLFKVPIERIEDPALYHLFSAQRDELDRMITMIADRGTPQFLLESQQVFGRPDNDLVATSHRMLERLAPGEPGGGGSVDATQFAERAEMEIAHYREAWPDLPARVEIRDDVPGLMVSRGHFLVGDSTQVSTDRIEATLHHEVGTHILTYYNGLNQPLSQFHTGMPGYEETQEGLAVLSEYLSGGLTGPRLRLLAGRVVAVNNVVNGADFVETFRLLRDTLGFDQRAAFNISMRVHRGDGFTKDTVYLRGLIGILEHLGNGRSFDDLMLGKVALDHIDIVEELRWRRVVAPGPLKPRYLETPVARERLATLSKGVDVLSLVDEHTS
ncbi:MAG: flavohemoglobin expression-modulating QEGLA motif protein [Alphaproteobacteria bacterium]